MQIQAMVELRSSFLIAAFKHVEGDTHTHFDYKEVAKQLGLNESDARKVSQYLVDEGLLDWAASCESRTRV